MKQQELFAPALVCAYGESWLGMHPLCDAHGEALAKEFAALVASGHYDAEGYTRAERKKQRKRA